MTGLHFHLSLKKKYLKFVNAKKMISVENTLILLKSSNRQVFIINVQKSQIKFNYWVICIVHFIPNISHLMSKNARKIVLQKHK